MSNTKIKAGQFSGIIGHGTDGYFLMTNGDGTMSWSQASTGPSITSVDYPGDDTAADPAGGQTVVLTGTGFATSGMSVTIGGTTAPSVSHDSNTQLTITTPAKAAGDYDIVVTNGTTGASGTFVNGISYNGIPTWTTAAGSLGTFESETTISTITLQATEPDGGTITFNITSGALPSGLSLTGANIDGTTTAESSTTLYSFTIEAIDDENQATPRNFSITVNSAFVNTDNFNVVTYTGNGGTQSISSLDFQPDLVWIKNRDTTEHNILIDVIRQNDTGKFLSSNLTNPSFNTTQPTFNSNGFTLDGIYNGYLNINNNDYVAWCFKGGGTAVSNTDGSITSSVSANQDAGFSIVEYTASSSPEGDTIGHGLSSTPELIIVKSTSVVDSWAVYHKDLPFGYQDGLTLNTTNASLSSADNVFWYSAPTTLLFSIGRWHTASATNIAYCFHSVDGYQKVGSYTGNGSATGPIVTLGFQPRFLIVKRSDVAGAWCIFDSLRDTINPISKMIVANESSDEYDLQSEFGIDGVDFLSDGFQPKDANASRNALNGTYIYLAIA